MQVLENVDVDIGALIGWRMLSETERGQLLERFSLLASQPPEAWQGDDVVRLNTPEPLYLLRAAEGLRIIFRRGPNARIVILDMVLQETLDRYFAPKPNGHA
jgi:hypothetical protein